MSPFRFARVALVYGALASPFALILAGTSAVIEPIGRVSVNALLALSSAWQAAVEPAPAVAEAVLQPPHQVAAVVSASKAPARRVAPTIAPDKPQAVFVPQATVLRLAQSSARPRGGFVSQTAQHPAGLRLSGVATLGIGLQDGDILIEALGINPRHSGEMIGAIIAARAKQARYLSGTLWRNGHTFRITVEQPYRQPA